VAEPAALRQGLLLRPPPRTLTSQEGGRNAVHGAALRRQRDPGPDSERPDHTIVHDVAIRTELAKDLGRKTTIVARKSEQDVLGADVVVLEAQRLAQRELERTLRARRERDLARRSRLALADFVRMRCRTSSTSTSSSSSTRAAIPSSSRIRPSRRCSVPM